MYSSSPLHRPVTMWINKQNAVQAANRKQYQMSFADLPKSTKPTTTPSMADLKKSLTTPQAAAPVDSTPVKPPKAKAKPALVAVEPEPEPELELEPDQATHAVTTPNQDNFLAQITGHSSDSAAALLAAHDAGGGGDGGKLLFPTLTQAGGPAGGAFQRVSSKNRDHMNVDLPEGKSPFNAVFMCYRYEYAIWPDAGGNGATAPKPIGSGAVPTSKPDVVAKLLAAGKAFQFSRGRDKHYESNGGPGVIKPTLAVMLFDPDTEQVFVYRTPGHYSSAQGFKDQLLANSVKDANGNLSLKPFFGVFAPHTEKVLRPNSTNAIVWHFPKVTAIPGNDATAAEAAVKYKKFLANASAELTRAGGEWVSGSDQPVAQKDIDAFDHAIQLS